MKTVFVLKIVTNSVMYTCLLVKMMSTLVVVLKTIPMVSMNPSIKVGGHNVEEIVTGITLKCTATGVKMDQTIMSVSVNKIGTTILWVNTTLKE